MKNKQKVPISQFKATCLQLIKEVNKMGNEIIITRFGQEMVKLSPVKRKSKKFLAA